MNRREAQWYQGTSSRAGVALIKQKLALPEQGLPGENPGSEGIWPRDARIKLKLYFWTARWKL